MDFLTQRDPALFGPVPTGFWRPAKGSQRQEAGFWTLGAPVVYKDREPHSRGQSNLQPKLTTLLVSGGIEFEILEIN